GNRYPGRKPLYPEKAAMDHAPKGASALCCFFGPVAGLLEQRRGSTLLLLWGPAQAENAHVCEQCRRRKQVGRTLSKRRPHDPGRTRARRGLVALRVPAKSA